MEVIRISFNAIFPLCIFIFLGLLVRKFKILNEVGAREMTMVVFRLLLPIQIFNSIYKSDLKTAFNPKVVLFIMSMYLLTFFASFYLVGKKETDNTIKPVMIQGCFKANFTLIAVPVVSSLCTNVVGIAPLMVGFNCIYANILSVFIFCYYGSQKRSFASIVKSIAKNPIIISTFLGFLFNLLHIKFTPIFQKDVLGVLGSTATPIALIALGAGLKFRTIKTYKRQAMWTVGTKLLILPAIFVPLGYLMGLRGEALVTLAANAAAPIAVNSYSLAVAMGGNEELADILVVLSTMISMVTMFVVFCVLGLTAGFN